jgi:putative ABC transport system permease protein
MSGLLQDLRYALRQLGRSPGFTAVALATLALGVGANTAIFSVIDAALLRPLPYKKPNQLVYLWSADIARGIPQSTVSIPDLHDWREQNQVFDGIAAFSESRFNLSGGREPVQVSGLAVTANMFDVLGASPELGRTFASGEDQWGKDRVVILSHALWIQVFGGDRGVIGKPITLNAAPRTVIGVLPPEFSSVQSNIQLWVPASVRPGFTVDRNDRFLSVIARLKTGMTLQQAQAEMNTIAARLAHTYREDSGVTAYLVPIKDQITGAGRPALLVLLGAVAFVLLIACANLASLLLARSAERQTEFSIRAALGSGRFRLARQLLTESLLLSFFGSLLGIMVATAGTRLLRTFTAAQIPRAEGIRMDAAVLCFGLGLCVITGLFIGLAPALHWSRRQNSESLKEGGRGLTSGTGGRRLRNLLTVFEMALALMLLVGAALLVSSFRQLRSIDPGFKTDKVLTSEISLPFSKYHEGKQRIFFFQQLLERVRSLPGVKSAGATLTMPLSTGSRYWMDLEIEGRPKATTRESVPIVAFFQITPGYLRAMGIPLIQGRAFDEHDNESSPRVALISQSLAHRYFSSEDAIGKHIRINSVSYAVVGVTGDVVVDKIKDTGITEVYTVHSQADSQASGDLILAIRTDSSPLDLAANVRAAVTALDKDQAVANIQTLEQVVGDALGESRLQTTLLTTFAGIAVLLAAIGIYGVLSYSVAQRTHEIGLRMALGAEHWQVLRNVLGQGLTLTMIGIGLGLCGAFLLTRFLSSMLYGVKPIDLPTFFIVSLTLSAVATLASYVPARRAAKVDPMVALRYE